AGQAQATCTTMYVAASPGIAVNAAYSGDPTYGKSSGALTEFVDKADTTSVVALSLGTNPSTFTQPLSFTATITAVAPGSGTPQGVNSVVFKDGITNITGCTVSLNAGGVATCTPLALTAGVHSI